MSPGHEWEPPEYLPPTDFVLPPDSSLVDRLLTAQFRLRGAGNNHASLMHAYRALREGLQASYDVAITRPTAENVEVSCIVYRYINVDARFDEHTAAELHRRHLSEFFSTAFSNGSVFDMDVSGPISLAASAFQSGGEVVFQPVPHPSFRPETV